MVSMSDDSQNPPPPANGRLVIRDGVEGVRVSAALIDDVARMRAAAIYARNVGNRDDAVVDALRNGDRLAWQLGVSELADLRSQQLTNPPQEYVVRYYAWEGGGQPYPQRARDQFNTGTSEPIVEQTSSGERTNYVPYVRDDNRMRPINAAMREDVESSFATIASQLPGRFRFVRVDDPAEADIQIASVPTSNVMAGVASRQNGSVLLSAENYGPDDSWTRDSNRRTAIHEILHALGLAHPQDAATGFGNDKAVTEHATFFDTQLTYEDNDDRAGGMSEAQRPVGLGPSDIEALMLMYPVAADRDGTYQVGIAAGATRRPDVGATVTGNLTHDILLPLSGVVYQPVADTTHDVVQMRASTDPAHATTTTIDSGGGYTQDLTTWPLAVVEQNRHGLLIGNNGDLTTAAYVQLAPEEVRTSAGSDRVVLTGGASVYVEKNATRGISDGIKLSGSGNRVSVPADDPGYITVDVSEGHYDFTIRNAGVANISLPRIYSQLGSHNGKIARWGRDEAGIYHVVVTDSDNIRAVSMTFELEDPSPQAHAQMQVVMDQRYPNPSIANRLTIEEQVDLLPESRIRMGGGREHMIRRAEQRQMDAAAAFTFGDDTNHPTLLESLNRPLFDTDREGHGLPPRRGDNDVPSRRGGRGDSG